MGRVWLALSFQAIDGQSRGFNLSAALPASGSLRLVASVHPSTAFPAQSQSSKQFQQKITAYRCRCFPYFSVSVIPKIIFFLDVLHLPR